MVPRAITFLSQFVLFLGRGAGDSSLHDPRMRGRHQVSLVVGPTGRIGSEPAWEGQRQRPRLLRSRLPQRGKAAGMVVSERMVTQITTQTPTTAVPMPLSSTPEACASGPSWSCSAFHIHGQCHSFSTSCPSGERPTENVQWRSSGCCEACGDVGIIGCSYCSGCAWTGTSCSCQACKNAGETCIAGQCCSGLACDNGECKANGESKEDPVEATCATYTCTTPGWIKKASKLSKKNPEEKKCCKKPPPTEPPAGGGGGGGGGGGAPKKPPPPKGICA